MKRMTAIFFVLIALTSAGSVEAAVHVNGYYRKNGTYVQPHYRSDPDGSPYNNWSYPGNTNPYTGKVAPGNSDTYLNNYFNRSSTYTPSFSVPSISAPSLSIPKTHSCFDFGLGATYNYLTEECECSYGYVARNNRCVSDSDACKADYGFNATNTFGGKCQCRYGYRFNSPGTACISNEDYCKELDWNSEWNLLTDSCRCQDNYIANSTKSGCIRDAGANVLPTQFYSLPVVFPKATTSARSSENGTEDEKICGSHGFYSKISGCGCEAGYQRSGIKCVFVGCSAGNELIDGKCHAKPGLLNRARTACLTKRPCTCAVGYEPIGNSSCIPK